MKSITVDKIDALIAEGAYVLDVRNDNEREHGQLIEGAHHIALGNLSTKLSQLPKDKPIYVHCKSGGRSSMACGQLESQGYDCYNVEGGYDAYSRLKKKALTGNSQSRCCFKRLFAFLAKGRKKD